MVVGCVNNLRLTRIDGFGNPLAGRVVRIDVNGVFNQNVTMDSNGQARFTWRPNSIGNFSNTAEFRATGSDDFGYQPSSDALTVNIKPAQIVNAQGTQILAFQTAQGTTQSTTFTISFAFPALGIETITTQLDGRTAQATSHLWNEFPGWTCYATFLGACILPAPIWKIHLDDTISNLLDFRITGDVFGGGLSDSLAFLSPMPHDTQPTPDPFDAWLGASSAPAAAGIVTEFVNGGPQNDGAVVGGGVVTMAGLIAATAAGFGFGSRGLIKAYLFGGLVAPVVGISCFLNLLTDIPALFPEIPLKTIPLL